MNSETIKIRESAAADRESIEMMHLDAFGEAEGREVSRLAGDLFEDPTAWPLLSLVAEDNGRILGHVLFTAVRIVGGAEPVPGSILAPLGVSPGTQGRGIGGKLVRAGLERLRAQGVGPVFVLGHPEYYPRFGFEPAGRLGLDAPYPIPEEHEDAWMVQELNPGFLGRVTGTVACAEVLDRPEHWAE